MCAAPCQSLACAPVAIEAASPPCPPACQGVFIVAAWAAVCRGGASPLASAAHWATFLTRHGTLRLTLGPLLLPLHAGATLLLFFSYRGLVGTLQKWLPTSRRQPVLNRALALGAAWSVVNFLAVGCLTGLGAWASCRLAGVPIL